MFIFWKRKEVSDFLSNVSPVMELHCFDIWKTKWQSTQTISMTKGCKNIKPKIKPMIIVFIDVKRNGYGFSCPTQSIHNSALHRTFSETARKSPKLLEDGWILLTDNAPAHTALLVWQFLAKIQIPVLVHTIYSTVLTLHNSFLFFK
jgi:hypothetical protein